MSDSPYLPDDGATIPPPNLLLDPDATLTQAQLRVESGTLRTEELADLVRADQRNRWLRGDRVRIESYLAAFPSLRNQPSTILDLLLNEITLQEDLGETPDLDVYGRRFPELAEELSRQYDVRQRMTGPSSSETQVSDRPHRAAEPACKPTVAGYEILGELGHGGMGVVYKARQLKLNRLVALKMIIGGVHVSREGRARFRLEAEAVASLQHPNIVQIYEIGEQDGLPYFALEFVDGGTLADLLEGDPMAPRPAAELVATLARAMHAAHQLGIIHRDLKPDNILMTHDGRPKITDFGLAKRLDRKDEHTHTGSIMGTPNYMAPEQAAGNTRDIGVLADVYALGAILYELLTRRPPFDSDSALETLRQVVEVEAPPPSRFNPQVPRDLETICLKCLAKEPHRRYTSAEALTDDLQRYLSDEPILARPIGVVERLLKWTRRHPALAALIGVAHLALLAGVGGAVDYHLKLEKANEEARSALIEKVAALEDDEKERRTANRLQQEAELNLIDLTVLNGLQRVDSGDLLGSLPWLVRALQLEMQRKDAEPVREKMHRVRIGAVLRRCPRMLRLLFHPSRVTWTAYSPDGRFILTASADGKARLWDADTEAQVGEPLVHGDIIYSAAFAPGGKHVVTASADRTARVWDVATRKALVLSHEAAVNFAIFSPDGKHVVTASDDRTAQVWDAATGKRVGEALRHKEAVVRAAFSPNGAFVATASTDSTSRLWETETGAPLLPILAHTDVVNDVAFSVDGRFVATASADHTACIWLVKTRGLLRTLHHTAPVRVVAFAGDGRHLLTAGDDNSAHVWNGETGERIGAALKHASAVLSASFHQEPHLNKLVIATSSDDNTARVWDAQTGSPMSPPLNHNGTVVRAVFHPTQMRLLTASADGTARVWSASAHEVLGPGLEHDAPVTAASFSPDGRLALTANIRGCVDLWEVATGQRRARLQGEKPDGGIAAAVFSPDGRYVAAAGADRVARLWDVDTLQRIGPEMPHDKAIRTLAFSADSRFLVTGSADRTARMWEVPTGRRLATFVGHAGAINSVAFNASAELVLTASNDRTARIWDTAEAKRAPRILQHAEEVKQASFSPDGARIVTACADRSARLWETATGKRIGQTMQHADKVIGAIFDPVGDRVLTASEDNTARIWSAWSGQPQTPPMRHGGSVLQAAFDHKGMRVVTGSADSTARVWSAANAVPLTPPLPQDGNVVAVAFAPNGQAVITGSTDRTARIWSLPPDLAPLEDLEQMARLMAGCRIDSTGGLVPLPNDQLQAIWDRIGQRPMLDQPKP